MARKKLKKGFTTGACATVTAKAAAKMLVTQKTVSLAWLILQGEEKKFQILKPEVTQTSASCYVIKDAGDDPDITNKAWIKAQVAWRKDTEIKLHAGEGIGTVTKKGLPVAVGEPAINPVPRKMIKEAVRAIIGEEKGLDVTISIPGGEKLAEKTFNPKLGVVGGLSIIGTTGIVEPMSTSAWIKTLEMECSVMAAGGNRNWIGVPGNHGRDFARDQFHLQPEKMVKFGNFPDTLLEQAQEHGAETLLLVGHVAKLVKIAGGIFHLHSKVADGRLEILTAELVKCNTPYPLLRRVVYANTVEEAASILVKEGPEHFFHRLSHAITQKAKARTGKDVEVGTILFSYEEGSLGMCSQAKKILEVMTS